MHLLAALACASALVVAQGQPAPKTDQWAAFRFLIGQWSGEGAVQGGSGAGVATFRLDLGDQVLVRTNHAEYPATAGRPAIVHDDLMVLYREAPGQPVRAIYWDNEAHVIDYDVSVSADGKAITFLSKGAASAPRFRLVYTSLAPSAVNVKFEMAPPGSSEFKTYTEAVTHKVK